ncbi:hypothetical protein HDU93_005378, partial [Gonapodya sp. JEL0774]
MESLRADMEKLQAEKSEWDAHLARERDESERWKRAVMEIEEDVRRAGEERERWRKEAERAGTAVLNLQGVLEQFQAAREADVQTAAEGLKRQVAQLSEDLGVWKAKAEEAEAKLKTFERDSPGVQKLQKELSEKNVLVGRLRADVILLQKHLSEAMGHMKTMSEGKDNNVDRRLISNLVLNFLQMPRG